MKRRDPVKDLPTPELDLERWVDGLVAADRRFEREALLRGARLVAAIPEHGSELLAIGAQFAQLMAELKIDTSCLVAGLAYRAVSGRNLSLEAVEAELGSDVAHLIAEVLRTGRVSVLELGSAPMQEREARDQVENVRLMLVAMIDDVRVAVLTLAERIIALRLIKGATEPRQRRIAREVLSVFAPLANRLGIWRLKWELEDLAFRYEAPEEYRAVAARLAARRAEREDEIEHIAATVRAALHEEGIDAQVFGRAKHIYSIVRKMRAKNVPLEGVYDVRAVRVVVDRPADCYAALGVIHTRWHHIPLEFDEYIANPKPNGYRSIHTAVVGPDDRPLEIQIRTLEMHREAELGVCSHWVYKDGSGRREGLSGGKLDWLRQVLEWHDEVGGLTTVGRELRSAIEDERIFVFTPQGHVLDLTAGSTAVDFAYRVHTEIGHRCVGATLDGRAVPLTTKLASGQRVEIVTAPDATPSRDWLDARRGYIRTARARAKVQAWFRAQPRDENVRAGREILTRGLARLALSSDAGGAARAMGFADEDALCLALALGDRRILDVVRAIARSRDDSAEQPARYALSIDAHDRAGLLHDVTSVVADARATMSHLAARSDAERNTANIRFTLAPADIGLLADIVDGISCISGVVDVRRVELEPT